MGFQHAYLPPHLAVEFARVRHELPTLRTFLAQGIEERLALLDALDGDADLEADADLEPSLGSSPPYLPMVDTHFVRLAVTQRLPSERFVDGVTDDREEENEHGGDIQDELHDPDDDPAEPSLGSLNGASHEDRMSQEQWARGGVFDVEDDQGDLEEDNRDRPSVPDWDGKQFDGAANLSGGIA